MQLSQDPSNVTRVLAAAFPSRLAREMRSVLAVMPGTTFAPVRPIEVEVEGETVAIPPRIHHEEPEADREQALSGTQRLLLSERTRGPR